MGLQSIITSGQAKRLILLALLIDGGLDILLGCDLQVRQDFQTSFWEG